MLKAILFSFFHFPFQIYFATTTRAELQLFSDEP